jgi:hypothetical protein
MLGRVKSELTHVEPLPAAMRQASLAVAAADFETLPIAERSTITLPAAADVGGKRAWLWAALAASVLAAASSWALWLGRRTPEDEIARPRDRQPAPAERQLAGDRGETRRVGPITVVTVDSVSDLTSLTSNVAALQSTLSQATAAAERLAVEQALDRVLTDYQQTIAARE